MPSNAAKTMAASIVNKNFFITFSSFLRKAGSIFGLVYTAAGNVKLESGIFTVLRISD